MSFEVSFEYREDTTIISFTGAIDENADFTSFKPVDTQHLILDLKEVNLLNSVGLRNWINWIRTLPNLEVIEMRNCTVAVINQVSVLEGFVPLNGVIHSFEVPYLCDSCETEIAFWAKRGTDYQERTADKDEWNKIPTQMECPKCGKTSEMDVIAAKYFRFLSKKSA